MRSLRRVTPESIAEDLFDFYGRSDAGARDAGSGGLRTRWRRARLDRRLGAADFGDVLRAYRALERGSRASRAPVTHTPQRRLAA